jgi:regulator of nonsense transcripts 2
MQAPPPRFHARPSPLTALLPAAVLPLQYVSEAVAAVAEAPLKIRDLPAAVQVCSALHQRYAEFAGEVVPALGRIVGGGPGGAGGEEERGSAARRRTTLRLLVELLSCGLYTAHAALLQLVRQLSAADFKRDAEGALAALALVGAFAKAGREELLGLPHAEPAALPADLEARAAAGAAGAAAAAAAAAGYREELARRWALAPEAQAAFRAAAERLLGAAGAELQAAHAALGATERENERVLNSRGDLPESLAAAYEAQRSAFEALQRGAGALAEVLERPLPELEAAVTRMAPAAEAAGADAGAGAADAAAPFDDEETKAFYEGLPDLRAVVPAVLLGEAEPKEEGEGGEAAAADADAGVEGAAAAAAAIEADAVAAKLRELKVSSAPAAAAADGAAPAAADEEGGARRALDAVLARLPTCVSRELCDEVAVEFCYAGGAGKGARRRLARALCDVPHGALQLLPYYGRIAAVLAPAFPDVAAAVVAHLEAEFSELGRRKDATARTLEPRVRNARYAAELLKFRLFPPGAAFSQLKALLDDFSGHNVDAACALVEAAGRYLSRRPDTATRLTNMLDVMVKLRNARNLDPRQAGLVDSSYFAVRSSGMVARRKRRPPAREYVRHQIYERLGGPGAVAAVVKRLRRLDWSDPGEGAYVAATLLRAARKGRHSQLPLLASLAAGLSRYHPALGVALVDAVVEEVAAGLEAPEAGLHQRRVAMLRLLGELYAYRLANSALVFATLHALVELPPPPPPPPEGGKEGAGAAHAPPRPDPPGSFFRARLACTLLEACGAYFARGAARARLDDFLPYLQRYVLAKPPPVPLDVELDLQDLYSRLKLDQPQFATLEEAAAAVAAVEARAAAAGAAAALQPIAEEEEELEEELEEEEEEGGSESEASGASGDEAAAGSSAGGGSSSEGEGSDDDEGSESSGSGDSEDDSDADSEELEDEDEEDEDEEEVGRPPERSAADEEFDRELAALMGDAGRGGPGAGKGAARPAPAGPAAPAPRPAPPAETLAFRVMLRRGGREDRTRELLIPVPAGVAEGLREKEARDAAEKAEVKRLVLASDRREMMEEAPGFFGGGGEGAGGHAPSHEGRRRGGGGRGPTGYYQRGRSSRALW